MNCKPGDLAFIVASRRPDAAHLIGHVVNVVNIEPGCTPEDPVWITSTSFTTLDGTPIGWFDTSLRPIRDSDGEDEMLRIAGKPKETVREIIKEQNHVSI